MVCECSRTAIPFFVLLSSLSLFFLSLTSFRSFPFLWGACLPIILILYFIMDSTSTVISGRGRDTYATAVSGGGRAGHPPSSTSDCQELGVGNLAPALDTASGRAPQVGDLACGVSNAPGRVERKGRVVREDSYYLEDVESMQRYSSTSPVLVRTHKRARSPTYSSEEEELRVDLDGSNKQGPAKTLESVLDTDRLLKHIRDVIQGAENVRKRFIKTEDEASRKMKHCHNEMLEMIDILRERLHIEADDPPSTKETIAQLKKEIRAKEVSIRELTEEIDHCKKENRKIPLNPLAARSQTMTRGTAAPGPCRGPSALISTSDRHTTDSDPIDIQELVESVGILENTISSMQQQTTIGADGPHKGPTLRAESTRSPAEQEGVNVSLRGGKRKSGTQRRRERRQREREVAEISLFCTEETAYKETLERGRIDVGLTKVRVYELRQQPLRCHRCLAQGHVAAMCPATKSRTDLCYVCGKPGHLAKTCTDKPACPVCVDAGRKPTNHRAGSWECPVVPPRKWVDKVFGNLP
ncbi:uncharacterized protein LOC118443573 isoform X2 [Vespa mandarinia]|uniref:uncharacterized protein LOC118443573 isoform X2 n=1 Tax=Vespa mandarinia TaxID=7446 RepID=UPI00161E6F12|nr:uncharacterized protein LOC118443573 isoform X2 [Vespa mandarinia]